MEWFISIIIICAILLLVYSFVAILNNTNEKQDQL